MINNNMNKKEVVSHSKNVNKKPNEHAGFYFSTHLKIFDPNTKKILVQKRGDN